MVLAQMMRWNLPIYSAEGTTSVTIGAEESERRTGRFANRRTGREWLLAGGKAGAVTTGRYAKTYMVNLWFLGKESPGGGYPAVGRTHSSQVQRRRPEYVERGKRKIEARFHGSVSGSGQGGTDPADADNTAGYYYTNKQGELDRAEP